jgi:hypothetical protein
MRIPDFFIIGAPRCGTTAWYMYLSAHPRIFMPTVKELHYFASDFPHLQKVASKSDSDYLKIFSDAQEEHLAVGEASPFYMYSSVALKKIQVFNPSARLIVSLRNPANFVESVHQLNLGLLRENEPNLEKAWALQKTRAEGKRIPPRCREPQLLQYGDMGSFSKYLEKAFTIFPRGQIKVLILEEFIADPKKMYDSVLAFLGVPSDGRMEFPPVNSNYEIRSQFFAKLIHPPQKFYELFMKTGSLLGVRFMKAINVLYGKIETMNLQRVKRKPMDAALRSQLSSYFKEDVEKLSILLGKDLSVWWN